MADNTTLNTGTGGDVIRDIVKGAAKTQVVTLDLGGSGAETLINGVMPISATSLTQTDGGVDRLSTVNDDLFYLMNKILKELKKIRIHMEVISDNRITDAEV